MLFSAPLEVARTKACTRAPRWTSASVRCDPMNPSAPVTSAVRFEKTSAKSEVRRASSSAVQTLFVALVTGGTITRLVRRFVVALERLVQPSLGQWLRRTRFGRAIGRIIDDEDSYEPDVLRALQALVGPGETCADVGA